jgi:hypothetical protein
MKEKEDSKMVPKSWSGSLEDTIHRARKAMWGSQDGGIEDEKEEERDLVDVCVSEFTSRYVNFTFGR